MMAYTSQSCTMARNKQAAYSSAYNYMYYMLSNSKACSKSCSYSYMGGCNNMNCNSQTGNTAENTIALKR